MTNHHWTGIIGIDCYQLIDCHFNRKANKQNVPKWLNHMCVWVWECLSFANVSDCSPQLLYASPPLSTSLNAFVTADITIVSIFIGPQNSRSFDKCIQIWNAFLLLFVLNYIVLCCTQTSSEIIVSHMSHCIRPIKESWNFYCFFFSFWSVCALRKSALILRDTDRALRNISQLWINRINLVLWKSW